MQPPVQTNEGGVADFGKSDILNNLCDFVCSRGYCPEGTRTPKDEVEIFANLNPVLRWSGTGAAACDSTQRPIFLQEHRFAIMMVEAAEKHATGTSMYNLNWGFRIALSSQLRKTADSQCEKIYIVFHTSLVTRIILLTSSSIVVINK
jgi:hypothetical protein